MHHIGVKETQVEIILAQAIQHSLQQVTHEAKRAGNIANRETIKSNHNKEDDQNHPSTWDLTTSSPSQKQIPGFKALEALIRRLITATLEPKTNLMRTKRLGFRCRRCIHQVIMRSVPFKPKVDLRHTPRIKIKTQAQSIPLSSPRHKQRIRIPRSHKIPLLMILICYIPRNLQAHLQT